MASDWWDFIEISYSSADETAAFPRLCRKRYCEGLIGNPAGPITRRRENIEISDRWATTVNTVFTSSQQGQQVEDVLPSLMFLQMMCETNRSHAEETLLTASCQPLTFPLPAAPLEVPSLGGRSSTGGRPSLCNRCTRVQT